MSSSIYSHQRARSSLNNLFDLLADLDDHQIQLLLQDLNNTTRSNMAVSQAVNLFESIDSSSGAMQPPPLDIQAPPTQGPLSTTSRLRLSLKTVFRSHRRTSSRPSTATPPPPSSSTHSSPSPSYRRISRPMFYLPFSSSATDLHALLSSDLFESSSPSSTASPVSSLRALRHHASIIDLALEAERSAVGPENIGLGFLEPRPITPTLTPGRRSPSPSVTMDSIFEVMESC